MTPRTLREAIQIRDIGPIEGTPDIGIRAMIVASIEQRFHPEMLRILGFKEHVKQEMVSRILNCAYGEFREDLRELRFLIRDLAESNGPLKMQTFEKANAILDRISMAMFDPNWKPEAAP